MLVSLEIPEYLGRRIACDPGELPCAAPEGLALEAVRFRRRRFERAFGAIPFRA